MPRPAEWQALVDAPLPVAKPDPDRRRGPGEGRKRINRNLWNAIDQDDHAGVREALSMGASLATRRYGDVPLVGCVRMGRWGLAQILAAEGNQVGFIPPKGELWTALADRDRPEDVPLVEAWGLDFGEAEPGDFLAAHAPRMLEAWCDRRAFVPALASFQNATGTGFAKNAQQCLLDWLHTAAMGSPRLRDRINQAWGIDPQDPHALDQCLKATFGEAGIVALRLYWEHILADDDAEQAQASVAAGWAPSPPRPLKSGKLTPSFSWVLLKQGRSRLSAWWFGVPAFLDEARKSLHGSPEQTWFPLCRNDATAPRRLHALDLGIDWLHADADGETVAHVMAAHLNLTLKVLEDLLEIAPDLLFMADHEGRMPLDCFPLKRMGEANQSALQARLLEYRLTHATHAAAPPPLRLRM